jgi:CIC family chloride channel protein
MEELREESNLRLEDALRPVTVPVIQGSETIASLAQYEELKTAPVVLVHCSDGLWYAAKKEELEALSLASAAIVSGELTASLSSGQEGLTLEQRLGAERTPVLFPDLPLSSALPHFQRWPLLPITNRAIRGSLEGVVSLQDVLNRYQQQKGLNHN